MFFSVASVRAAPLSTDLGREGNAGLGFDGRSRVTANDPRLDGLCVLVLEDEYILADDARRLLQRAGAAVMGPYGNALEALTAVARRRPDCAVLDLNLGTGPDFGPARALEGYGVPVVFFSGYDPAVIPADFRQAKFLQKPIYMPMIVDVVATICGRSAESPATASAQRAFDSGSTRYVL
jgi:FixJ family two-component response regulator